MPRPWAAPAGVILIVTLLVAGFGVLSSALVLGAGPSDDLDSQLYLLTLFGLAPAAFVGGRRIAEAFPQPDLTRLAASAAGGLMVVVLAARLAHAAGWSASMVLLVGTIIWGAGLVIARPRPAHAPLAAAVLACLCVPVFLSSDALEPLPLAASLALGAVFAVVHLRGVGWSLPRWATWALEVGVVVALVFVVTDADGYLAYQQPGAEAERAGGIVATPDLLLHLQRLHQGFWSAPVNDVLHGRTLLVDTTSQYGVGSIYFLAAFFSIAPLGYGPLALLTGFLTGLQYALVYGVLRLVRVARTVAVPAMVAAVVGLALGSFGSPADFPATGGLRFGLPWGVLALAVLAVRFPGHRRILWAAAAVAVGVASVWSLEVFAYSAAALAGASAFARVFARTIGAAAACCVFAHLVLAVATRVFGGAWPGWSEYLAFLESYSGGDLYLQPVGAWSAGLPLFGVYLASALGVAALLARGSALVDERAPALAAVAGCSGFGIVSFSYFVGHSNPNTLKYVALPALACGCLWMSLAGPTLRERRTGLVLLGGAFWVAALIALSGLSDARAKWERTALAQTVPGLGGGAIWQSLPRLWRSPPSDPRAPGAQVLLSRHFPPGAPALVIAEPDLTVETLMRSDRVNLLPISDPEQDDVIRAERLPEVLAAVDRLPPGTLMLLQTAALDAPAKGNSLPPSRVPGKVVALQKRALERIRSRFGLETIESEPGGLSIVRLVGRRS